MSARYNLVTRSARSRGRFQNGVCSILFCKKGASAKKSFHGTTASFAKGVAIDAIARSLVSFFSNPAVFVCERKFRVRQIISQALFSSGKAAVSEANRAQHAETIAPRSDRVCFGNASSGYATRAFRSRQVPGAGEHSTQGRCVCGKERTCLRILWKFASLCILKESSAYRRGIFIPLDSFSTMFSFLASNTKLPVQGEVAS